MPNKLPFENRPGWAILYPPKNKQDWQGDYLGVTAINAEKYWITAWEKTTEQGDRYLLINLKPKEGK
jgi:hypothetical protein